MKRFILAISVAFFLLSIFTAQSQANLNTEGIGSSFDIRRIDISNLSRPTMSSQKKINIFKLHDADKSKLSVRGILPVKNSDADTKANTYYVITDYDFETTVLKKLNDKSKLDSLSLAMFSSAYNYKFNDTSEPETLYVYTSFYDQDYTIDISFLQNRGAHNFEDDFVEDVKRLGRDITPSGFIYRYGTHYASKTKYGGHFLLKNRIKRDAFRFSSQTPEEFTAEIITNIKEDNSIAIQTNKSDNPNRISIGKSESFTVGGDPTFTNINQWKPTVTNKPALIAAEFVRVSDLLTSNNFPNVRDIIEKQRQIDSIIVLAEQEVRGYLSKQREHNFFERKPIKFRQKVTTVEKIDSGFETDADYTGVLFMGFFGQDEVQLIEQPIFGRGEGDIKSLFTEEIINTNKILEFDVDTEDLKHGYVSVWDDAKKVVKGQQRTALRVSGTAEAKTSFNEAMNIVIKKDVTIVTIEEDRYDVSYTIERVKDYNDFDNSSFIRNDILDSEIVAAASNGDIKKLQEIYRSGGNKYAKGVISAAITSPVHTNVLNAIMDEGVKATTEDLDIAFDPDFFNPHKVLALLERGAKPKNNMIYKTVAYNYPEVVYALLREGAKPVNNDLDFAIRKKRYKIAKALMNENIEGYVANEEAVDLAVQNEDEEMTRRFIDLGGKATSSTFSAAASTANRIKDRAILNMLVPVTEANNETLEAAARIDDVELYKFFIAKDAQITDNSSVDRAIENKNNEILQIALANKGEPTEALKYAIKQDNKAAVVISLENKAEPNESFNYAVEKNDTQLFNDVLNKFEGNPAKALEASVDGDNIQLARAAIASGDADVTSQLQKTIKDKDITWVSLLVNNGADVSSGIETSVKAKKPEISKLLLERGADANLGMVAAVEGKQTDMVKMLLDYSADATLGIKGAVENNDTEMAILLLEKGANPLGMLKTATRNLNINLVKKLIEKGADPKESIVLAINSNSVMLAEMLIKAGADVSNSSYMYTAIKNNNALMAKLLFDSGSDVSYVFDSGDTYLHTIAEMVGAGELMKAFLTFGLNIDAQNNFGETPLHLAVMLGNDNLSVVKALLSAGVDVHIKNKKRRKPYRVAKGSEIKNLLSDYGGDD